MVSVTAAVVSEPGAPFTIREAELDDPRDDEVRVRLVAVGVCHTDAIVRDGGLPIPFPAVLGHEGAGVVEAVGAGVTSTVPGDHVVLGPAYCRRCARCRGGQVAYCANMVAENFGGRRKDGSAALSTHGNAVSSHFFGQSSFATHANVSQSSVVPIDPAVPLELMAPLGCGLQTGAGTVFNEIRPTPGSSLAVTGVGAVGMAAVMAARIVGSTTIIAVDRYQSRLETALEVGATHVVDAATADVTEELLRITGGSGVDGALDTTGRPEVMVAAQRALAVRGVLALVGTTAPGTVVPFELGRSMAKGWTIKTAIEGSCVPQDLIPRLVALWRQGRFPIDRLIQTYQFDEINAAFADSAAGGTVKPVLLL